MSLDAATARLVESMRASGTPPIHKLTPTEAREVRNPDRSSGPAMHEEYDVTLNSADGAAFEVRVLRPEVVARGVVIYCHGGGWVLGSLDRASCLGRVLAQASGFSVVVVGYRKAPEEPYPAAVEDCWSALTWASQRVGDLVGRSGPLVLMGDSSGGNLAALVAIRARDRGGPHVDLQALVYPVTDCDLDRDSYHEPDNQLIVTRDAMRWFWDLYLPDWKERARPEVCPLQVADLSGLPPAVVLTAEYDVIRDEAEAYADALESADVVVSRKRFDGQMHGFFSMVDVLPGHRLAVDYLASALRELANRKAS